MKKVALLCLLASVSLLLSFIEIISCIPTNSSISVPYSISTPTIDGQWSTTTEWNNASENKMTNELGWSAYLRLKHNETHIFALLDFVSDQTDSLEDHAIFAFDANNEGGNTVNPDDYKFSFYHRLYFAFYDGEAAQGTGLTPSRWVGISQPSGFILQRGFSNMSDPYESREAHSLFEAAFPRSILNLNGNIGFYASVNDSKSGTALEFPVGAGVNSPGSWGDIVIEPVLVSPSPSPTQSSSPRPTVPYSANPSPSASFASPTPSPSIPEMPSRTMVTSEPLNDGSQIKRC